MTYDENELRKYIKLCDGYSAKIIMLKEKLEFANKTSDEAVERFFEQQKKMKSLYGKISELEVKLEKDVQKAREATAEQIFKEMYDIVCDGTDYTIIVNATDIKAIAKRYGVKL